MFASLLILLAMPLVDTSRVRGSQFRPIMRFSFWLLVVYFLIRMWVGSCRAESPYIEIGATVTVVYFAWFLVIVPVVRVIENTLMDIDTSNKFESTPWLSVYYYMNALQESNMYHLSTPFFWLVISVRDETEFCYTCYYIGFCFLLLYIFFLVQYNKRHSLYR